MHRRGIEHHLDDGADDQAQSGEVLRRIRELLLEDRGHLVAVVATKRGRVEHEQRAIQAVHGVSGTSPLPRASRTRRASRFVSACVTARPRVVSR